MKFLEHDQFSKELKTLNKKYRTLGKGLDAVKRLFQKQFDSITPEEVIAPGKIHRLHQNSMWSLWKIEVAVPGSGLKPNQWPRMWFAVSGDKIVLLAIAAHMQNYDNNKLDAIASGRVSDYF